VLSEKRSFIDAPEYGLGRVREGNRMKKLLVVGIAAAAFCGAPALAADMPVRAPVYKAAPAPIFNWSGFYLGIEGGGGWADTRHTNALGAGDSGTTGISGGLFGGTYGYNAQAGSWVLGLEGDISWSGIEKNFNDTNGSNFCGETIGGHCVTNLHWLGTDRVRLGYAWDRLLVYGTAGVAYGNVGGTIAVPGFLTGDRTHSGFTFGGGVEWAFAPNWSAKAEYLRADLGNNVTYGTIGTTPNERVSLKSLDIVRIGLNYRFGDPWGKAPVSAKY
jgi:outer membrane immunogenic protein